MESRFDLVAKVLAGGVSRREALRRLGGVLGGAAMASFGLACADSPTAPRRGAGPEAGGPLLDIAPPGRCKLPGQQCREATECCTSFCVPDPEQAGTGQCGCPRNYTICGLGCCPTGFGREFQCCSGVCTYTAFDRFNCGACGKECAPQEFCYFGVCRTFF